MDFTQEDFKNLLIKISENEHKLNQFMQGWNSFKSEIKEEIQASICSINKGYLNYKKGE